MSPLDNVFSIIPKPRFVKKSYVSREDIKETCQLVSQFTGRATSNNFEAVMHNRNHENSPETDLSLWLPWEDVGLVRRLFLSRIVESKHSMK